MVKEGKNTDHLSILARIGETVNNTRGFKNTLNNVVQIVGDSLGFDVVSIYLYDEKRQVLRLTATRGLRLQGDDFPEMKPSEGLTGYVFETRRPLAVMPASGHPRYKFFPEIGEEKFESYLGVPVILRGTIHGVMVAQIQERRYINPAEVTLFEIIASRIAALIEVVDRLDRFREPDITPATVAVFQGEGVSGGFAYGPVYLVEDDLETMDVGSLDFQGEEEELERLNKAIEDVDRDIGLIVSQLREQNSLSENEIRIFEAHQMMVRDPMFKEKMEFAIRNQKICAELSVRSVTREMADSLMRQENPYFRDRAHDYREIGDKLIRALTVQGTVSSEVFPDPEQGAILVGSYIGTDLLARMSGTDIGGIVSEKGGETSHAVLLAQSLGLPAVVGTSGILGRVKNGDRILVDGRTGYIFKNPDEDLVRDYRESFRESVEVRKFIEADPEISEGETLPWITANIGFPQDVHQARKFGVRDIGLLRTEFNFMRYREWPDVETQKEFYLEILNQTEGVVTVRTLDVGADKTLPYLDFPREQNPLLGLRATRYFMEHLDLFRDQVKAILLAAKEKCGLRILLPMVTSVWEVESALEIVSDIWEDIGGGEQDRPELGIMVEVPATSLILDQVGDMVDFISVGTNDLTQYLLAVDRDSEYVRHLYSGHHPAIIRILHEILQHCGKLDKPVAVCGELAGTAAGALILLSLGYEQLSVIPSRAPIVRFIARRLDPANGSRIAASLLAMKDEREIEDFLKDELARIDERLNSV